MIRVLVSGAAGKMGQEVVKAISVQSDMEFVGGVDPACNRLGQLDLYSDLVEAITETKPDVVVDFTHPGVIRENLATYQKHQLKAVIGTTGLSEQDLESLRASAKEHNWAALIAPNFAIGAVLMMKFAVEAAKHFPNIEIIEYHHEQKKDSPSGTAIKTAEMISENLTTVKAASDDQFERLAGARGANLGSINIHSVRLPGYVAHQEVICGLPGQNLTIRHDSTHRESFMPGVVLAVRKIGELQGITYGLEHILFNS